MIQSHRSILPDIQISPKVETSTSKPAYIFADSGSSVFAFSCVAVTHNVLSFALLISPLRNANLRPIWTTSQTIRISSPTGAGRRYVKLRLRLTPPREKTPGREAAMSTVEERLSMMVVAHPPWRLPVRLQSSGVTVRRYVAWAGGPGVADSTRAWTLWSSASHP